MKKVLVVGYGVFGKLVVDFLSKDFSIWVCSRREIKNDDILLKFGGARENIKILKRSDNNKVIFDYIVFAVPVQSIGDAAKNIKKYFIRNISKNTIIADVSSVKSFPLKVLKNEFGSNQIIGTHPMFGVSSIEKKLDNLKVVISNISGNVKEVEKIKKYIKKIGFKVIEMKADEHDKKMAKVQALTHFIGAGIKKFDLVDDELKTYSYRLLYALDIDTKLNTKELFETIQKYNPYAKEVRKKLINELIEIDRKLE